jgi:hypothetical protein
MCVGARSLHPPMSSVISPRCCDCPDMIVTAGFPDMSTEEADLHDHSLHDPYPNRSSVQYL